MAQPNAPKPDHAAARILKGVDCPKAFWEMVDRSLHRDLAGHPHVADGWDHLDHSWYNGQERAGAAGTVRFASEDAPLPAHPKNRISMAHFSHP